MALETEKKFIIEMPIFHADTEYSEIVQTYLISNSTERVRKRVYKDYIEYTHTEKKRVGRITREEREETVSEEEYLELLKRKDPKRREIVKTRYLIKNAHTFEIDVYPFYKHFAVMEVELKSEDEKFEIPDGIKVLFDVSTDKRFTNSNLALDIPEKIGEVTLY